MPAAAYGACVDDSMQQFEGFSGHIGSLQDSVHPLVAGMPPTKMELS
jgi:hypothetical protein